MSVIIIREKVKTCPFCGKKPRIEIINDGKYGQKLMIWCDNRFCAINPSVGTARLGYWKPPEIAIEKWNRRKGD